MTSYATGSDVSIVFRVKNLTARKLTVLGFPVHPGQVVDLMKIPGISEEDIRASLSKGELKSRFNLLQLQVISSTVNLNSDDSTQKAFLTNLGIQMSINQVGASMTRSVDQTAASSSTTIIDWDTVLWNNGGDQILTGQNLTTLSPGKFIVHGQIMCTGPTDGTRTLVIAKNGEEPPIAETYVETANAFNFMQVSTIVQLEIGDYVELWFTHDSSSDQTISATSPLSPVFTFMRLGP